MVRLTWYVSLENAVVTFCESILRYPMIFEYWKVMTLKWPECLAPKHCPFWWCVVAIVSAKHMYVDKMLCLIEQSFFFPCCTSYSPHSGGMLLTATMACLFNVAVLGKARLSFSSSCANSASWLGAQNACTIQEVNNFLSLLQDMDKCFMSHRDKKVVVQFEQGVSWPQFIAF